MEQREPAKSFTDLTVWQLSHEFVLEVYRRTASFPKEEQYGLTSQLRRGAVSVPANIAEGFARRGKPDKVRFMNNAQGSLEECRYYLILAQDLHYGDTLELLPLLERVGRMLQAYRRSIAADVG